MGQHKLNCLARIMWLTGSSSCMARAVESRLWVGGSRSKTMWHVQNSVSDCRKVYRHSMQSRRLAGDLVQVTCFSNLCVVTFTLKVHTIQWVIESI